MLKESSLRLLFRVAFIVYAPILLAGTHWPALEIQGEGRPDLVAHLVGFGLWTALLLGAGFFGPALSWRNIGIVFIIAAVYSALAEATQAIPFIRRHAAFDDFLANLLGVLLSCSGAIVLMKLRDWRIAPPWREAGRGSGSG